MPLLMINECLSRKRNTAAAHDQKYLNFRTVNMTTDPCMQEVKDLCEGIKAEGYNHLPNVIGDILLDVSSVSSLIYIFKVVDIYLINDLRSNLTNENKQLMIDTKTIQIKQRLLTKYPVIYKRPSAASNMTLSNGKM